MARSRSKARSRAIGTWHVTAAMQFHVKAAGKELGVFVAESTRRGTWNVVALEVPRQKRHSVQRQLDQHAHRLVAEGLALSAALAAAETFARGWLRDGVGHAADCACEDITPSNGTRPPKKRRQPRALPRS